MRTDAGAGCPRAVRKVISKAEFGCCIHCTNRADRDAYRLDRMTLSSRERIAPSLLVSAMTKRTRPVPADLQEDLVSRCSCSNRGATR